MHHLTQGLFVEFHSTPRIYIAVMTEKTVRYFLFEGLKSKVKLMNKQIRDIGVEKYFIGW